MCSRAGDRGETMKQQYSGNSVPEESCRDNMDPFFLEEDDYESDPEECRFDGDPFSEGNTEREKRRKNPEQLSREADFLALYEEFMHPSKAYSAFRVQCQLEDLYLLLYELNRGWAYGKANVYRLAGFLEADGEDALSVGCEPLYELLKQDRLTGNYSTYPVSHYSRIVKNKAIDQYFRSEFGRLPAQNTPGAGSTSRSRKRASAVSIDTPETDSWGTYRGKRIPEASVDPFAETRRSRRERDAKSARLAILFIRELMNYPSDPPKPLALMYGNVLFQLYKDYGGEDALSMQAKKSPKISSPEWAHRRMGTATLSQLGTYAARVVQKYYDKSLSWGPDFNRHMAERTVGGIRRKWADIVYTETYTVENTSQWIESVFKSTVIKCSRKLAGNRELTEYAIETLGPNNKFRKALEKAEKEAC